jgi:dCMP deaminase
MFSQLCQVNEASNNLDRLNCDEYFMSIALIASQHSPCQRLQVGCVVVKDNRLLNLNYLVGCFIC